MNPLEGFDSKAVSLTNREKEMLLRRHALHCKYEKAVELYADTDQTLAAIAETCRVSVGALGKYLRRYWRGLGGGGGHIFAGGEQLGSPENIGGGAARRERGGAKKRGGGGGGCF